MPHAHFLMCSFASNFTANRIFTPRPFTTMSRRFWNRLGNSSAFLAVLAIMILRCLDWKTWQVKSTWHLRWDCPLVCVAGLPGPWHLEMCLKRHHEFRMDHVRSLAQTNACDWILNYRYFVNKSRRTIFFDLTFENLWNILWLVDNCHLIQ